MLASNAALSAMMVADLALLPYGPTQPETWSLTGSLRTLKAAMECRPQLRAAIV